MKIVVNDIAASEGGAISVLRDFYAEVKENGLEHEWVFLLGDKYVEEAENIKVLTYPSIKSSWFKRLMFDFFTGRKIIDDLKADTYFSMQNTATLGVKSRQIVYLHQSLPYQKEKNFSFFVKEERSYAAYQKIIGKIYDILFRLTKSEIIVQTHWMYDAISQRYKNSIEIVQPKIESPRPLFFSTKKINNETKRFFYPASNNIYKNHGVLLKAFSLVKDPSASLVLTLDKEDLSKKYHKYIDDRIIFLGKISREKVFEMYSESILVFPSYIEAYGLPLMEAKMLNRLIIASDTAFSQEILSNYDKCIFFDYQSADELFSSMNRIMEINFSDVNEHIPSDEVQVSLTDIILNENKYI